MQVLHITNGKTQFPHEYFFQDENKFSKAATINMQSFFLLPNVSKINNEMQKCIKDKK